MFQRHRFNHRGNDPEGEGVVTKKISPAFNHLSKSWKTSWFGVFKCTNAVIFSLIRLLSDIRNTSFLFFLFFLLQKIFFDFLDFISYCFGIIIAQYH